MEEIWLPVVGHKGRYEVSNLWNVKSLNYNRRWYERVMKPTLISSGYLWLRMPVDWKWNTTSVHSLVAQAFISNPENKRTVNHINWIKTDNRVENLEWNTYKENIQHAFRTWLNNSNNNIYKTNHPNTGIFWKDNNTSKTVYQYDLQSNFIKEWWSTMDIWRELWINRWNINSCCLWKKWHKSAWWFIWSYSLL